MIEIVVIIVAGIIIITYLIARSKCVRFKSWCCEIDRDVELEEKAHEFDVKHGVSEIPKFNII